MNNRRTSGLLATLAVLVACSEPPPPRSVQEFIDNPLLLEAALVRCTQNRAESRYNTECINAREAVKLIEAQEDDERQAALEEESRRKREALRRNQQAAAEARRLAEEARRRREEAEYLAQFGELPPSAEVQEVPMPGNEPGAVIPDAAPESSTLSGRNDDTMILPTAGSNAPVVEESPVEDEETPTDLNSIRDELRRRSDDDSS